jgi:ribonuclease T
MHDAMEETYISVDVETAGPNPSGYSLLSIGACTLYHPQQTFYVELIPVNDRATAEALAVSGLSLEALCERGVPPAEAMEAFAAWVRQVVPSGSRPVFAAFNAPFDWMFVHDYFYRYLGYNPFGYSALDIKALYMGLARVPWTETSMRQVGARYLDHRHLAHHALEDALDQAEILTKLLAEIDKRGDR